MATEQTLKREQAEVAADGRDVLSVTDERTGKKYELPITDGTIHGPGYSGDNGPATSANIDSPTAMAGTLPQSALLTHNGCTIA